MRTHIYCNVWSLISGAVDCRLKSVDAYLRSIEPITRLVIKLWLFMKPYFKAFCFIHRTDVSKGAVSLAEEIV